MDSWGGGGVGRGALRLLCALSGEREAAMQ